MPARTAVTELFHTIRSGLWPLARLHRLPPAPPAADRPVVLVHGYLGNREMLRPLARRLLRAGLGPVARVGYPSAGIDLPSIARRIEATARPLATRGPIDLVGHSLGAVACRAWIKAYDGAPWVRHFVSLGGPHAGTCLYRAVSGPLRDVLDPRGPWVARLAAEPEPVPTTVIRARYDHQVFPPARASIPAAQDVVISGIGHNGLLWSARAHRAVIRALDPTA